MYGGATSYGGGGMPVAPHSPLDYQRLGIGKVPSAEYPDGYLGTLRSRRATRTGEPASTSDAVLDSLKVRSNQRAYQRGVHKGERIDPSDYYYPQGLDPQRGLRAQAAGRRQSPLMDMAPAPHLVNDGKADPPQSIPGQIDPRRSAQFARLRPNWK